MEEKEKIWLVKGRLTDQEPVIYQPTKSIFIKRILEYFHVKGLHQTAITISQKVSGVEWATNLKQKAKNVIKECLQCSCFHKNPEEQVMAMMPEFKTQKTPSLLFFSIDFVGELTYLTGNKKNHK
jgi:hypothetical protein